MSREDEVFIPTVFYPVRAVAEKLQVDVKTLYNIINSGDLKVHRLYKRTYRLEGGELNEWLATNREGGEER